jgi:hypothetical protein
MMTIAVTPTQIQFLKKRVETVYFEVTVKLLEQFYDRILSYQ